MKIMHNGQAVVVNEVRGAFTAVRSGVSVVLDLRSGHSREELLEALRQAFPYQEPEGFCAHPNATIELGEERQNCKGELFRPRIAVCPDCGYRSDG